MVLVSQLVYFGRASFSRWMLSLNFIGETELADLRNATFSLTEAQIEWIESESERTGLAKADIVRRAIDGYVDEQETKQRRELFTREERAEIKQVAKMRGITEKEVVRQATKEACDFMTKLDRDRKRSLQRRQR